MPAAAVQVLRLAERRPALAVVLGQWFAVVRTLVPRVAGSVLPYHRFAVVSIPVAAAWGLGTFTLGCLLAQGSATAARLVAAQQTTATVLLALLLLTVVGVLVRGFVRRRAIPGGARPAADVADRPGRRRHRR